MTDDWVTEAACAGMNLSEFFPAPRGGWGNLQVCAQCPVRIECLAFAMKAEGARGGYHRYGIFGGTTPKQRGKMARGEFVVLDRACKVCGQRFIPVMDRAVFCGSNCQRRDDYERAKERQKVSATGTQPPR